MGITGNTSGHIWNSEPEVGEILASIIRGGNYKSILELGFFMGYTSMYIAHALLYLGNTTAKFDMVDISSEHLDKSEYKEKLHSFERAGLIRMHIGDSVEIMKSMDDNSCDLIFIDTTHTLEQTRNEFKQAERLIKTNGIIALHDSISHPGVKEWVDYIKKFDWLEVITLPTSRNNGLTLVKCLIVK